MQSRRDFIKNAAMLSGAAGFAAGIPASVRKAFAIAPDPGTTWADAEHVVILMQENRSFDHSLGTLQGVRGFNDPRAIRQANGNSIFLQTSASGDTYAPWRLDIKDTKITWMGSIPHVRNSQVDAWNQGHHNAWIDAKRSKNKSYTEIPITMGHYTREDIPFYYALADAFTVCDQNYCSVMSSTTPNRSMFWTGTIRDKQDPHSAVYIRNPEFGDKLTWATFPERLTDAGVDWGMYQNDLGEEDSEEDAHQWCGAMGNMTRSFSCYNAHMTNAGKRNLKKELEAAKAAYIELKNQPIPSSLDEDRKAELKDKRAIIQSLEQQLASGSAGLSSLSAREQELHRRAYRENTADPLHMQMEPITFENNGRTETLSLPKGDIFYQFRKDVQEDKLPLISWLFTPPKFSDHPTHPWYGAWFVSEAVDILTSNPEVWKKTIFILTYDENDGYFDHSPSFVAADPKNPLTGRASEGIGTALDYTYAPDELAQKVTPEDARSGPIGLGFRVPLIVASPWTRGGWVNSEIFDHTSTLQFLETFVERKTGKKIVETNISPFRRTICGDLTSVFQPADHQVPKIAFLERNNFLEGIERAKTKELPSNFTRLKPELIAMYNTDPSKVPNVSRQEPGIRPSSALPYEMFCEGSLSPDGKNFILAMRAGNGVHGARSAGAPFNVYLHNTAKSANVLPRGANNQNMHVSTYVVKAGDTLREGFPLEGFAHGKYEIDVHGPNGFFRSFRGEAANASPIKTQCLYAAAGGTLTSDVEAQVTNISSRPVVITVTDESYKTGSQTHTVAPGQKMTVPIKSSKSHGWYDFSVQPKDSSASMRYAGRVETGRNSYTDPLMGGMVEA
jgi:phospholipase C